MAFFGRGYGTLRLTTERRVCATQNAARTGSAFAGIPPRGHCRCGERAGAETQNSLIGREISLISRKYALGLAIVHLFGQPFHPFPRIVGSSEFPRPKLFCVEDETRLAFIWDHPGVAGLEIPMTDSF